MLTREYLEEYLDHFNNKRYGDVVSYFADDVEVRYYTDWSLKLKAPQRILHGRDAFVANYEALHQHCDEKLRLGVFLAREGSLFVELYTSFTALHDTDTMRCGFMKKGETMYVNHFINYILNEKDQFRIIMIAQCQTLDPKDATVWNPVTKSFDPPGTIHDF